MKKLIIKIIPNKDTMLSHKISYNLWVSLKIWVGSTAVLLQSLTCTTSVWKRVERKEQIFPSFSWLVFSHQGEAWLCRDPNRFPLSASFSSSVVLQSHGSSCLALKRQTRRTQRPASRALMAGLIAGVTFNVRRHSSVLCGRRKGLYLAAFFVAPIKNELPRAKKKISK